MRQPRHWALCALFASTLIATVRCSVASMPSGMGRPTLSGMIDFAGTPRQMETTTAASLQSAIDNRGRMSRGAVGALEPIATTSACTPDTEPQDPERFYAECTAGDMAGCARLGFYFKKQGRVAEAQQLYLYACTNGGADGCRMAGVMALEAGNRQTAESLFRQGCEMGDMRSCSNLGGYYLENGSGTLFEYGFELSKQACLSGVPVACGNLGVAFFRNGQRELGLYLVQAACSLGNCTSCRDYAEMAARNP